jgi:hypothetical protein
VSNIPRHAHQHPVFGGRSAESTLPLHVVSLQRDTAAVKAAAGRRRQSWWLTETVEMTMVMARLVDGLVNGRAGSA